MATANDIIFYRYSPERMPEEILRKLFVGREKLLESLVKDIENAAFSPHSVCPSQKKI